MIFILSVLSKCLLYVVKYKYLNYFNISNTYIKNILNIIKSKKYNKVIHLYN